MFIPTTQQEVKQLGWHKLDVILVSGDSYIDSPFIGAAVIGKVLMQAGFRVGIIAQPATDTPADITRLGEPALFWGVTAGSIDSMLANHTAALKKRRSDDYTPGGQNTRRPDRATIVYSNLIRRHFKQTAPIVLGGIEASLRRVAHYDYWSDRIRGSVLLDAKADFLIYGMGESTAVSLANALRAGRGAHDLPGLCYASSQPVEDYLQLPSLEAVSADKQTFIEMFHLFYQNNDPLTARGLCQQHGQRWLVQNPPAPHLTQAELDNVYSLDYERAQHPYYEQQGAVRALDTIRFSLTTHRGCYGECNFCAIAVHEGRTVRWRSQQSILREAELLTRHPDFKGYIQDVGGPTANMYGFECQRKLKLGPCPDKRCLYPEVCSALKPDHAPQIELLKKLRALPGVKKVFVASGLRYDLLLADTRNRDDYIKELAGHHVSGQLKVAPEHVSFKVLKKMGKPGVSSLGEFKQRFDRASRNAGKEQFLTYYFIAAHPGCSDRDMYAVKEYAARELKLHPEQVQIFTPTPSTYSSLMYYTETDPFTGEHLYVEKTLTGKLKQKAIVTGEEPREQKPRPAARPAVRPEASPAVRTASRPASKSTARPDARPASRHGSRPPAARPPKKK
ncbi:MAG: YgiQ family radical SAM protein [Chloroflexi bacterium]|nr:YgiQ family radical SAM protein [Chloroflexota bacterium]